MTKKTTIAAIILAACCMTGCQSPFFRSTQGTLTNVGVSLPNEEMLHFQLASYLHGDSIVVKDKSEITYSWKTCETNSYFGIIRTQNSRTGKIEVKK